MPGPYHSFYNRYGEEPLTLCVDCMLQRAEQRRATNIKHPAEIWVSNKEQFPICDQCGCTFDDDPRLSSVDDHA